MPRDRRPVRRRPPSRRERLEASYPTVVRYTGVVLTVVLVIFTLRGHGVDLAAGYVAAATMMAYKSVRDGADED